LIIGVFELDAIKLEVKCSIFIEDGIKVCVLRVVLPMFLS